MHKDCVIFELSSITYAQKAKYILKNYGINSDISKTVNGIDGCGYKLRANGNANYIKTILTDAKIPVRATQDCD